MSTLPLELAELVDEIDAIDSSVLDGRSEPDSTPGWERKIERDGDWFAWAKGEKLHEARAFLRARLAEAKRNKSDQSS